MVRSMFGVVWQSFLFRKNSKLKFVFRYKTFVAYIDSGRVAWAKGIGTQATQRVTYYQALTHYRPSTI